MSHLAVYAITTWYILAYYNCTKPLEENFNVMERKLWWIYSLSISLTQTEIQIFNKKNKNWSVWEITLKVLDWINFEKKNTEIMKVDLEGAL